MLRLNISLAIREVLCQAEVAIGCQQVCYFILGTDSSVTFVEKRTIDSFGI